jgi:hypothetical protein
MPQKQVFRYLWVISILVMVGLSCSLLSRFVENTVNNTVNNVIDTQVGGISTDVGSLITEVDVGSLITEADIGSLITDININEPFGIIDTAFPEVTNTGEKPEGIPVMEPNTDLITNKTHVEFATTKTTQDATTFYTQQMPANGWTKVEAESKVENDVTTLVYTKDTRKATIQIEEDFLFGGTLVTIDVTGG